MNEYRHTGPRVLTCECTREEGRARFRLELRAEDSCFRGHFPGEPILPGVVQVDWAIRLGGEAFGSLGAFAGIQHLKFRDLTRPGEALDLFLVWQPGRLDFRYEAGGRPKSSGIVLFDPPDASPI